MIYICTHCICQPICQILCRIRGQLFFVFLVYINHSCYRGDIFFIQNAVCTLRHINKHFCIINKGILHHTRFQLTLQSKNTLLVLLTLCSGNAVVKCIIPCISLICEIIITHAIKGLCHILIMDI